MPWLEMAFLAALALTVWFGGRAVWHAVYWADPSHRDQPVAGWMTPGYIARSWDVPPEVVAPALGLPLPANRTGRPPPLDVLARETGVPLDTLIARLEAAIAAHRAASR